MKIGILTERMRLGFGVDLVVDQQARRLAALGFDVTVVVLHADLAEFGRPYRLIVLRRMMAVGDARSEPWIKEALARCNVEPDIWILHTPPFYDWAPYLNRPVVFVEYGAPPGHMFSRTMGRHLDDMLYHRFSLLYGSLAPSDAIVSISNSIHNSLPGHAQPLSTVALLGCDHYPRATEGEALSFRAALGVAPQHCLVLWVGRMALGDDEQPYKGFRELLSLAPLLQRSAPHVRLALAGRVSDGDAHALRQRGFAVLPNLSPEELGRAYAAADLLLNLSQWEGFNLALLEAQFQGTPVVAYDFGPHPEIVAHSRTGLLVGTPRQLFDATVHLVNDAVALRQMSQNAREFSAGFGWDANVAKLADIIADCMSRSHSLGNLGAYRQRKIASLKRTGGGKAPDPHSAQVSPPKPLDLVRRARSAVFNGSPRQPEEEAPWLRRTRNGVGTPDVLHEMMAMADLSGHSPDLQNLREIAGASLPARADGTTIEQWRRKAQSTSLWTDLSEEIFVRHAYRVLLGREAEDEAVAGRTEQLRRGYDRWDILRQIRESAEGRDRPVRDPDIFWVLRTAQAPAVVARAIADGTKSDFWPGFFAWFLPISSAWVDSNDHEFVRAAYRLLLGREVDAATLRDRGDVLAEGYSRTRMLADIRFSAEGRNRPLVDLTLRRLFFFAGLRRSGLVTRLVGELRPPRHGKRPIDRQLRLVADRQHDLTARLEQALSTLSSLALDVAHIGRTVNSLAESASREEEARRRVEAGSKKSDAEPVFVSALEIVRQHPTSENYAVLVAPGAAIAVDAVPRLLASAEALGTDVLFGDEWERISHPPFRRLRVHGPFSHHSFLSDPEIGGVAVVRKDLLARLSRDSSFALTCEASLQVIKLAHTVSHIPEPLSERPRSDIEANRATAIQLQSYLGQIRRPGSLTELSGRFFDVRFPVEGTWKAAIIVMADAVDQSVEAAIEKIFEISPVDRFSLTLVHADPRFRGFGIRPGASPERAGSLLLLADMAYADRVNAAVAQAPEDCSLLVILEAGVAPASGDWLERLAESALLADTGVVAPLTLYADGRVCHAGMAFGLGEPCGYVAPLVLPRLEEPDQTAELGRLRGLREVSAVSHHCLAMRRSVFTEQGQFATGLGQTAAELDFCCRLENVRFSVLVDGRVRMTTAAAWQRWTPRFEPNDLTFLLERHGQLAARAGRVWVPGRIGTSVSTVRLPPIQDR